MYTFLIVIALVYGLRGRCIILAIIIFIKLMRCDVSKPVMMMMTLTFD